VNSWNCELFVAFKQLCFVSSLQA